MRGLEEAERRELREAFDLFDSEKKGKLSVYEVKVLMRALGFEVSTAEVRDLVDKFQNGDFVDFPVLCDLMCLKYGERDPQEEILKAFALFDRDQTGRISLKNVQAIARDLGEDVTPEELKLMIEEFDTNLDGTISQDEFLNIMSQGAHTSSSSS